MKNVVLVTSSNRPPEKHTQRMFDALVKAGAAWVKQEGSPDVAFARCMALTAVCEVLKAHPSRDVVLMLDDDMIGSLDDLSRLCERASGTGKACSGVYATQSSHLAGMRWQKGGALQRDEQGRQLWLVGLGVLAIPRALLLELDERAPKFVYRNQTLTAFTSCGAEDGEWWAEDYRLCRSLGGVLLEPVGFGHIKKMPLWPDGESLQAIADDKGFASPEEAAQHVRHLDELFPGDETPLRPVRDTEPAPAVLP